MRELIRPFPGTDSDIIGIALPAARHPVAPWWRRVLFWLGFRALSKPVNSS